jgi:hypothetical protein
VNTTASETSDRLAWTRRLQVLLGAESVLLVLASVNRLWDATDAEVLPHGSLRVVDVVNLMVLAPASALVLYLLLEHVLGDLPRRARRRLRFAFVAALYLFAASYGMHEPADFIHAEFCGREDGALCESVAYHDDELSHGLFFAGLAGMDAVLLLAQAGTRTLGAHLSARERAIVLANASVVAVAIVANLGFEAIGLDLIVVAAVGALALYLASRRGARALIVYFAWAYLTGLIGTVAIKLA